MSNKQDNETPLVMPKATAMWFIDNTALTFEQIGDFTGLHPIEVQALADGDVGRGLVGRHPVEHGELTQEELDQAIADNSYFMKRAKSDLPPVKVRSKGPKYTPVSKRGDKPDAIAYLLKHNPEITDAQIVKLIGTTKPTISAIRDKSHLSMSAIKPRHPVDLGLCTYAEMEAATRKGLKAQGKTDQEIKDHQNKVLEDQEREAASHTPEPQNAARDNMAGFDFTNFLKTGTKSGTDDN